MIDINQDSLGVQAKKVAINGSLAPQFVGVAPCAMYEADASYPDGVPGPNGVTKKGMTFHARPTSKRAKGNFATFKLVGNETGRCMGLREYITGRTVPMLLACDDTDLTQEWVFPTNATRIGAILSAAALNAGASATALAVSNSTLYGPSVRPSVRSSARPLARLSLSLCLSVSLSTLYGLKNANVLVLHISKMHCCSVPEIRPLNHIVNRFCLCPCLVPSVAGGQHLTDSQPLLDASYGEMWLELQPYLFRATSL